MILVAGLAACRPLPPERLGRPVPIAHTTEQDVAPHPAPALRERAVAAEIPSVDRAGLELPPPPELTEYLRWPLSPMRHPALEPSYPIATTYALPGLAWTELCALGAQQRRGGGVAPELVEYLRAWCDVERHDVQGAVERLGHLRSSKIRGLPAAVRADLANVLVDAGPANEAEQLLARARIDDLEVYDLLAATYAEVGKPREAYGFNLRALRGNDTTVNHCFRLMRAAAFVTEPTSRRNVLRGLTELAGDRVCARLVHVLACANDPSACTPYYIDLGRDPDRAHLAYALAAWPEQPAKPNDWWFVASQAVAALAVPRADEVAVTALEALMRGLPCNDRRVRDAQGLALQVQSDVRHAHQLDERLDVLLVRPEKVCFGSVASTP